MTNSMRQSKLFTKTRREAPSDEVSRNAQLLIRAGFVHKEMAGVYSYLPLGLRVLNKIENIIREEMNLIGGQEVKMATLHPSENWKKTGGWDAVDVLFKLKSRTDKEYALGQSEEEIVTPILKEYASSYKDLPIAVYQIGQKYRDELRAKSGIMRGREFGMKDMYSFHATQEDFDNFYEVVKKAYLKIYKRVGLDAKVTEASGGSFSDKLSYEFMVLTSAGEDDILYCEECIHCANVEVSKVPEGEDCPKCGKGKLKKGRASEVGNVFDLGQKYPKSFEYTYIDQDGAPKTPFVGCYGIGTTRLMGTVVETKSNDDGIIWPESIAPYKVHLLSLGEKPEVLEEAEKIYDTLSKENIEVIFDDRAGISAGEKFSEADLLGIPYRAVVSERSIKEGGIELKKRTQEKGEIITLEDLIKMLAK